MADISDEIVDDGSIAHDPDRGSLGGNESLLSHVGSMTLSKDTSEPVAISGI